MKKKIVLLNVLLLVLVFSSCSLSKDGASMTIVNKSSEVITSMEIEVQIGVNEKFAAGPEFDSLKDGQTISQDEKVTFTLPVLASESAMTVKVFYNNDQSTKTTYVKYEDDANFTLEYNGSSSLDPFTLDSPDASLVPAQPV